MDKMKIAVTGAAGRMGRELVRSVHGRQDCVVAGAIEQEGSIALGQDVGLLAGLGKVGVVITDDPLELFAKVDAVLDFTVPKATVEFAGLAANARIVHVFGTTGLTPEDDAKIAAAARHATIVRSGNMSLGVNLLSAPDAQGRRGARCRLRHRDRGDAPPPQGRCPFGHGADAGQGRRRRSRRGSRQGERAWARRAHRRAAPRRHRLCLAEGRQRRRRSLRDLRRRRRAASSSPIAPPTVEFLPAARSRPRCGGVARVPGSSP